VKQEDGWGKCRRMVRLDVETDGQIHRGTPTACETPNARQVNVDIVSRLDTAQACVCNAHEQPTFD